MFGEAAAASHSSVCSSSAEASIDDGATEPKHSITYLVVSVAVRFVFLMSLTGLSVWCLIYNRNMKEISVVGRNSN